MSYTRRRKQHKVRIGLIQTSAAKVPDENLKRSSHLIQKAAKSGAQIICLQELFTTRYFPQTQSVKNFEFAETIPGKTTAFLSKLARQKKIVIIAPIFEKRTHGIYHNSAVIIDADGSVAGIYRKMHIPDDPGFYEKYYFTPGDLGFKVCDTRYGRIGVLICWDQWFPEAARLTALQGAEILFYPTAIGWNTKIGRQLREEDAWETIQRSHAIANGVYVAAVNRVGTEDNLKFWGKSFLADPLGTIICRANDKKEEILIADCDFTAIDETRKFWPFLRDRRVESYHPIASRYQSSK